MELAHPPSITVCQITSQTSDPSNPRSTFLTPWPKLKPTRRRCPVQTSHAHATLCCTQPPLMGHDVWGAQRKLPSRNIGTLVPCATDIFGAGAGEGKGGAGAGEGEGGDKPATEGVLKFYTAIKDRNVQVLAFLSSLMAAMGKRIEFVIQPTPLGGMNVGIQWKLDFDHSSVPFGKGFSFYTVQTYQGKAYIRNADTFVEPIVHGMETFLLRLGAFLGPLLGVTVLHQKWESFLGPIVERVSPIIKHKRTRAFTYCFLTLVTMCTLLTILKRFRGF